MDERTLVKRARRGDADAFDALVRLYERPMYALALSILSSRWDAADAVQEAFVEGYEHLPQLRDPDRFRAWLARITVNKCNQAFRRSSRVVLVEDVPERASGDPGGRESALDLMEAVRGLDPEHRNAVALRYFCDLKLEEVARVMGCPVGTVKSRLNRALSQLQAVLRDDGPSEDRRIREVAR